MAMGMALGVGLSDPLKERTENMDDRGTDKVDAIDDIEKMIRAEKEDLDNLKSSITWNNFIDHVKEGDDDTIDKSEQDDIMERYRQQFIRARHNNINKGTDKNEWVNLNEKTVSSRTEFLENIHTSIGTQTVDGIQISEVNDAYVMVVLLLKKLKFLDDNFEVKKKYSRQEKYNHAQDIYISLYKYQNDKNSSYFDFFNGNKLGVEGDDTGADGAIGGLTLKGLQEDANKSVKTEEEKKTDKTEEEKKTDKTEEEKKTDKTEEEIGNFIFPQEKDIYDSESEKLLFTKKDIEKWRITNTEYLSEMYNAIKLDEYHHDPENKDKLRNLRIKNFLQEYDKVITMLKNNDIVIKNKKGEVVCNENAFDKSILEATLKTGGFILETNVGKGKSKKFYIDINMPRVEFLDEKQNLNKEKDDAMYINKLNSINEKPSIQLAPRHFRYDLSLEKKE